MRRYLLDTTPLAAYLQGRADVLSVIRPWVERAEVATSILAYGEVLEHLRSLPYFPARHQQLRLLLRSVYPFLLTYSILERYAEIRCAVRRPAGPGRLGDVDLLIAATALERDLTVVTTAGDFQRVPGLSLLLLPR